MKRGTHVNYVRESGEDPVVAHVLADKDGTKLDLQLPGGGVEFDIPRRDPADYDDAGGGRTWHPIA